MDSRVTKLLKWCTPTEDSIDADRPSPPWLVFRWGEFESVSFLSCLRKVEALYSLFSPRAARCGQCARWCWWRSGWPSVGRTRHPARPTHRMSTPSSRAIPSPRSSTAIPPGPLPFGVKVVSAENRELTAMPEAELAVGEFRDVEAKLARRRVKGRLGAAEFVTLRNTGNAAARIRIRCASQEVSAPVRARIRRAKVVLQARRPGVSSPTNVFRF